MKLERNNGHFPSSHQYKKFRVLLTNPKKTIYFGDNRYEDYTTHHDEARKQNYLDRHGAREDFNNYRTAGFWSANLLWNKTSISASLKDIRKRFPGIE